MLLQWSSGQGFISTPRLVAQLPKAMGPPLWRKALVRVPVAPPSYVFPLLELSDLL